MARKFLGMVSRKNDSITHFIYDHSFRVAQDAKNKPPYSFSMYRITFVAV